MGELELESVKGTDDILCTHAIVDRNNNRMSTPRFMVYIIEAEPAWTARVFYHIAIIDFDQEWEEIKIKLTIVNKRFLGQEIVNSKLST